jgi:hypothetical protein
VIVVKADEGGIELIDYRRMDGVSQYWTFLLFLTHAVIAVLIMSCSRRARSKACSAHYHTCGVSAGNQARRDGKAGPLSFDDTHDVMRRKPEQFVGLEVSRRSGGCDRRVRMVGRALRGWGLRS